MRKSITVCFLLYSLFATAQKEDSPIQARLREPGAQMVSVRHGKYNVFTQKVGSGTNKLLLLPGGPGHSFEYFEIFPLWLKDDYEIYFYSPLGSYLSDQPQDTSLQTFDAYVEEVEEVRKALGLENFYVLGHSWAGRLALAYASKYQTHLKGLIISNATGIGRRIFNIGGRNITDYDWYQQQLIANIADSIPELRHYADSLRKCMITPALQPLLMDSIMTKVRPLFVKKHFLRLPIAPDAVSRGRLHSVSEAKMRRLVQDTQKQDVTSVLGSITIPTLFIGGKYDYVPPNYDEARQLMKKAADVTIYITPNGSHRAMWDDPENYFTAIKSFIDKTNKTGP
jgi:proline iminopeptidase